MSALLRLLSLLLPPLARERYLEEWRADLAGAAELGLPRRGVVLGALALLVSVDRDLPAHTGEARGTLPRRLARRGLALFAAAALMLSGIALTGGGIVPEPGAASASALAAVGAVQIAVLVAAVAVAVLGALLLLGAAASARTLLARISLVAAVVGPVLTAAGLLLPGPLALVGLPVSLAGLVCGVIVLGGSRTIALAPRTATRAQRLPVALAGLALVAGITVVGAVDLLVWNPQAKVPGVALTEIYATMAERDGFELGSHAIWVTGWAAFWTAAAIVVTVGALVGRRSPLTPRRIAVLMLALVAGAVVFRFFAGFGFGMSVADTFVTSGGDGSLVSAVLPPLGQLALAGAAIAVGWAPRSARPTAASAA
ncbi:hypothetical protein [Rathayibacter sp. AY1B5]|uniref:hypothetical protein n=1 Tax=Rathayibacter sp. AY1B5 TaxID=2080530 RepID=UPI000CE84341|nr:hypothetical protein [Rathayibacter sp. AY1B5]PPI27261.1 hypothetical protein C5D44_04290 [Rathayibacter sp. AY1B5]